MKLEFRRHLRTAKTLIILGLRGKVFITFAKKIEKRVIGFFKGLNRELLYLEHKATN
jgi:hypothetical protein